MVLIIMCVGMYKCVPCSMFCVIVLDKPSTNSILTEKRENGAEGKGRKKSFLITRCFGESQLLISFRTNIIRFRFSMLNNRLPAFFCYSFPFIYWWECTII